VNWGFLLLRVAFGLTIFSLLFLSQRFWYRAIWRTTSNWRSTGLRVAARSVYVLTLCSIILATADSVSMGHGRIIPRGTMIAVVTGLWFSSTLFGFLAVKLVRSVDYVWSSLRRAVAQRSVSQAKNKSTRVEAPATHATGAVEVLEDPSRRHFFRAATAAAGAAPFLGVMYGFAAERLNYQIFRVEAPVANLPAALDGLKIVQLSDIHLSGYMPREQMRRAVDMANELNADLAVVTGDFITGMGDPLADCVDEIRRLRAPLGVWGCNGNHEIYANAEDAAEALFTGAGMKLLRQENTQLTFNGAQFNLIGVDYQRERTRDGYKQATLVGIDHLVRRDMPNILLSHNPNTFSRAAELGIELSLAGHTHGGQIQVEILDHRLSPARFISDYVAGLYRRSLVLNTHKHVAGGLERPAMALLYVNRGLGTVGAPVRLGVPPEITLLTLRRA
jgi:predicted MPP superfamily phosphohydrolase